MRQRRITPRRPAFRPDLEGMESRILLATFLVTTTDDGGAGSLRQAILDANGHPGPDAIGFQIPAPAHDFPGIDFDPNFGVWRIRVASPLPAITDQVAIDGYSQRILTGGSASNETQSITLTGLPTGGTFTLMFEGQTTAPLPFNATADQVRSALEALPNIGPGNVTATQGPVNAGTVSVTFRNALGVTNVGSITGDPSGLIGAAGVAQTVETDTATEGALGDITSDQSTLTTGFNAKVRVILDGSVVDPATGNRTQSSFAGLTIRTDHNRIRGLNIDGFATGIDVQGPTSIGNLIQGNYLGAYLRFPNPTFTVTTPVVTGIGNGVGVLIASPTNNTVGGVSPETHNAIAGNLAQGVVIAPGATGNQVVGNLIGVLESDPSLYFQVGNGAEGVLVQSSSNAIGGAVTGSTNVISANGSYGVHIVGPEAVRNRVQANYIGTDVSGGFIFGQGNPGNGQGEPSMGNLRDGVFIENASNNQIGITGANVGLHQGDFPPPNVISGNFGAGVRIAGASATGNIVLGNDIGTDLSGASALPNFQEGVAIFSAGNRVGGLNPGDSNIISGNRRGVLISGPDATGNVVLGNVIGTDGAGDKTGTYDLGNAREGVKIDSASGNTVGGAVVAARNLISGNDAGVSIVGASSTGNVVLGNFIGSDVSGKLDLGNSQEGVRIEAAPGNTIGGGATGAGNLISANHWGVTITGPTATANVLQGNLIGTDVSAALPLGNEVDGVLVTDGAALNLLGGMTADQGNTIGFNIRDGVRIETAGSVGNRILSNGIVGNGQLGINLAAPGDPPNEATPDDLGPVGPNALLNRPALTSVASLFSGVVVTGVYRGAPNATFLIQLFASAAPDPSGFGEGERYLGTTPVTTGGDGVARFTARFPVTVAAGMAVTATATDAAGDTSEFSGSVQELSGVLMFSKPEYVVSEGSGAATITVLRSGGSGGFATVDYEVRNGTAMAGSTPAPDANFAVPDGATPIMDGNRLVGFRGTLVFDFGEFAKTISVPLLDDRFPGPVLTANLSLLNPTGAASLATPDVATLFLVDDDLPGAFRFRMADYVVNEALGAATITVVRDVAGIAATVDFATTSDGGTATPGVDYAPVSGTLSFAAGETSKTFTIPIVDDATPEGDETVVLFLSGPTGGATLASPSVARLTIQNDDRDRTGPTVHSVQFLTDPGGGIAKLVVGFSEPLNATTATDLVNYGYSVRTAGRDHRFGTRDDLLIPIRSAVYDPSRQAVTLTLRRGIHPPTPFQFAINVATNDPTAGVGVSDLSGNLLGAVGRATPGVPFVVVLSGRTGGINAESAPLVPRNVKPAGRVSGKRKAKPASPHARPTPKGPLSHARPRRAMASATRG